MLEGKQHISFTSKGMLVDVYRTFQSASDHVIETRWQAAVSDQVRDWCLIVIEYHVRRKVIPTLWGRIWRWIQWWWSPWPTQKPHLDPPPVPPYGLRLAPYGPKMKMFNLELEGKLYQHFDVEFDGESNSDGLEAQKPDLDPVWTPYWPHMGRKRKYFELSL